MVKLQIFTIFYFVYISAGLVHKDYESILEDPM